MSLDVSIRAVRGDFVLDAAFTVESGETLAVVGPNGSGKTTLLRVVAGWDPVDAGVIVWDGDVLDDPAAGTFVPARDRRSGLVPQGILLFDHLDVCGNVAFGLQARGVGRGDARDRALGWLERVGLGERARARPGELSGGQAQKVALVRTLAARPSLVLLDEPMAALDVEARGAMRVRLQAMLRELDATTLLVSHDFADVVALADRVVVLEAGRVAQIASPDRLRDAPATPYVAELVGRGVGPDVTERGRDD